MSSCGSTGLELIAYEWNVVNLRFTALDKHTTREKLAVFFSIFFRIENTMPLLTQFINMHHFQFVSKVMY